MSIEEVERIMDETQDAVEYQRVSLSLLDGLSRGADDKLHQLTSQLSGSDHLKMINGVKYRTLSLLITLLKSLVCKKKKVEYC